MGVAGVYIWSGPGTEPILAGSGAVVTPPTPVNRVRVSRVVLTTTGAPITPTTNPRLALVPGDYNPKVDQGGAIGVPVGPWNPGVITAFNGDYTARSNATIANLEIFGRLNVGGFHPTITNCIVHGNAYSPTGTETACIYGAGDNLNGTIIEDTRIDGLSNVWCSGIRGGNYTLRRVEMKNVPDCVLLTSQLGNVTLEASWIHKGAFSEWTAATTDVAHGGDGTHPYGGSYYTHVDGVQFHRGKHHRIVGNFIGGVLEPWDHHTGHVTDINSGDCLYNSSILLKQEVSNGEADFVDDVIIEKNWLMGGMSTLNITSPAGDASGPKNYFIPQPASGTTPARVGVLIRNNRFPRSTWDDKLKTRLDNTGVIMDPSGQAYILRDPGLATLTGNVFDDDGSPVPIRAGKNNV